MNITKSFSSFFNLVFITGIFAANPCATVKMIDIQDWIFPMDTIQSTVILNVDGLDLLVTVSFFPMGSFDFSQDEQGRFKEEGSVWAIELDFEDGGAFTTFAEGTLVQQEAGGSFDLKLLAVIESGTKSYAKATGKLFLTGILDTTHEGPDAPTEPKPDYITIKSIVGKICGIINDPESLFKK